MTFILLTPASYHSDKETLMASRFEISQQTYNSAYSMRLAHSHSYCELYYLMNGSCNMFMHDNTYRMNPGTILFIPANILHKTTYLENTYHERLYIEFTLDYTSDLIDTLGFNRFKDIYYMHFFSIPEEHREDIQHIFKLLITEKHKPTEMSPCSIKCHLQNLLISLARYCDNSLASSTSLVNNVQIVDASIQKAMNYIMMNYNHNITLDEVAGMLHLNSSYFSKKFKSVNGFGFKEYLNTVRINHSEQLLLETDLNITEIALQCGYDNSNYFGDAFKHLNKISPTQFRKIKGNRSET